MRPQIRALAALGAVVLLAAGCGRSTSGTAAPGSSAAGSASAPPAPSSAFGSLAGVCQPGHPTGAPDQGITASQITLGVLTDEGFTHLPDLVNTAKVFTSWCNAAGGINGRQLVADIGQTNLLQVVPAMTAACGKDFALVGNSEAFDGLGAATRVGCLLPEFPAQTVMSQNVNSALQAYPLTDGHSYAPYAGYYSWLLKQAYPDSAKHVGILYGQSPISVPIVMADVETIKGEGGTVAYNSPFPPTGVPDWTPYAEAIKSQGIKGLVFNGTFADLAKLELVLTNLNYKLDWIDSNSNSYGASFIALAGKSLGFQHNYADIDGLYPLEKAAGNPAARQLVSLFAKYAPGQPVTLQDLQGFSAWLLFARAAASCGNDVTRRCVYDASLKQTDWTAGGLSAPVNLAKPDSPVNCYDVELATPSGWTPAPFQPNNGPYRCGAPVLRLTGSFPAPVTLKTVGKTLNDLK